MVAKKFEPKRMLIFSKEEQEKLSIYEFSQKIPEDYNGLIFEEEMRDPIGKSGRESDLGRCLSI